MAGVIFNLLGAVIGGLVLLGLMDVFILVWVFWRGDKTDDELPRWYLKLSKWAKKKWIANLDRYERRQLIKFDEDEFRTELQHELEKDVE